MTSLTELRNIVLDRAGSHFFISTTNKTLITSKNGVYKAIDGMELGYLIPVHKASEETLVKFLYLIGERELAYSFNRSLKVRPYVEVKNSGALNFEKYEREYNKGLLLDSINLINCGYNYKWLGKGYEDYITFLNLGEFRKYCSISLQEEEIEQRKFAESFK